MPDPDPVLIRVALHRCLGTMSQSEFARRLGITRGTVHYWFTGRSVPDRANFRLLLQQFPDCADDLNRAFGMTDE